MFLFMNICLDKIIVSKDRNINFGFDKIYDISMRIAHGIA